MVAEIARQRWSAERYAETAHFVPALGAPVLEMLAPSRGEHILDLGCGDGVLTEEIAASGADVLGADLSEELLAAAAAKGVKVQRVDGHALPFKGEFDAVFTNAALHWMRRPKLVIAGVHRALKPRGRFVGEFGGHGNVAAIATAIWAVSALHGGDPAKVAPWFFPSVAEYQRLLEQGGLGQIHHARAAPDSARDRHAGLARDLWAVVLRSIRGAGDRKFWRKSLICCARRCAMRTGCGLRITSGSALLRSGSDESRRLPAPPHP